MSNLQNQLHRHSLRMQNPSPALHNASKEKSSNQQPQIQLNQKTQSSKVARNHSQPTDNEEKLNSENKRHLVQKSFSKLTNVNVYNINSQKVYFFYHQQFIWGLQNQTTKNKINPSLLKQYFSDYQITSTSNKSFQNNQKSFLIKNRFQLQKSMNNDYQSSTYQQQQINQNYQTKIEKKSQNKKLSETIYQFNLNHKDQLKRGKTSNNEKSKIEEIETEEMRNRNSYTLNQSKTEMHLGLPNNVTTPIGQFQNSLSTKHMDSIYKIKKIQNNYITSFNSKKITNAINKQMKSNYQELLQNHNQKLSMKRALTTEIKMQEPIEKKYNGKEGKKNKYTNTQFLKIITDQDQQIKKFQKEKQQSVDTTKPELLPNNPLKFTVLSNSNFQKISQKTLQVINREKVKSPLRNILTRGPTEFRTSKPNEYYIKKLKQYYSKPNALSVEGNLFREHFQQNFNSMMYAKILNQRKKKYNIKYVTLSQNPLKIGKKTLIFDLDETLIHCNDSMTIPYDVALTFTFPSGEAIEAGINIRPYAISCLTQLTKFFEIIIFTASHQNYASKVIEHLDPEKKLIDHVLYRDHCIQTEEGLHIKDLRVISNRQLENICLIDNASYSFAFQIQNGVPIVPFYNLKSDQELLELIPYVMHFLNGDIKKINTNTFQLEKFMLQESSEQVFNKLF